VSDVEEAVTRVDHEDWARVVAALTRRFGDLEIAEEAAAEAFGTSTGRLRWWTTTNRPSLSAPSTTTGSG
jgi:RNA polymerase sigma-70 factor, ECF subfamily